MIAEVVLDGVEMRAHRRARRVGITVADGDEDRLVLGDRARAAVGGPRERIPRRHQRGVDPADQMRQRRVARRFDQGQMKRDVGFVEDALGNAPVSLADGLDQRGKARLEYNELLFADALGRETRGLDLDDAPALEVLAEQFRRGRPGQRGGQDVVVEEVPLLARIDGGRGAVMNGGQAALFQSPQALACDAAANAEPFGDCDLARQ